MEDREFRRNEKIRRDTEFRFSLIFALIPNPTYDQFLALKKIEQKEYEKLINNK